MTKVVLISQFPLPYSGIGSWTTMYSNYLRHDHAIDYIVCAAPEAEFETVKYSFVKDSSLSDKIKNKFKSKNYDGYLSAIASLIGNGEKYVFQIVDNKGIATHLDAFLKKRNLRQDCRIQYFHHGFSPMYGSAKAGEFFDVIDELVLLTHASYKFYCGYYTNLPVRVSILHNGIDTAKFHKIAPEAKNALKANLGLAGKTVFMWCSQDRPKKGLDIVLDAWKRIYSVEKNMVLLVIGADRADFGGVKFVGKVPNDELPKYYQASDVYLFPTLCQEGFGMTLIEALHCGCSCIASAAGGVPEVLQHGKYGQLIENPHFVSDWAAAIENYLRNPQSFDFPAELYSATKWNSGMNRIINDAKSALSS